MKRECTKPFHKIDLFITKEGFEDVRLRASSGDISAKCAMAAFRFILYSPDDMTLRGGDVNVD